MKILLFGAQGFLGRHIAVYLRAKGHDIIPVSHSASATEEIYSINIDDEASLENMPTDVDVVINCAAKVPADQIKAPPMQLDLVNGYGVLLLMERLKHHPIHFIQISSSHCLPDDISVVRGSYEISKFAGDLLCRLYRKQFQKKTTIIRPSYIYGPSMRETTVVMNFIRRAERGKTITIIGNPNNTFNFIYVLDVAKIVDYAISNKGDEYFAVSGTSTSLQELAETIVGVFGNTCEIQYLEESKPLGKVKAKNLRHSPVVGNFSLAEGIQGIKDSIR